MNRRLPPEDAGAGAVVLVAADAVVDGVSAASRGAIDELSCSASDVTPLFLATSGIKQKRMVNFSFQLVCWDYM